MSEPMNKPVKCPIEYLDSISARVKDKPGLMVMVDLSEIEYLKYCIRQEREIALLIHLLSHERLPDESAINMATDPKGGFK